MVTKNGTANEKHNNKSDDDEIDAHLDIARQSIERLPVQLEQNEGLSTAHSTPSGSQDVASCIWDGVESYSMFGKQRIFATPALHLHSDHCSNLTDFASTVYRLTQQFRRSQ